VNNISSGVSSTVLIDLIPPSVPGVPAATVVSASEIDLAWSSSTDNIAVAGYDVYRNGSLAASTTGLSYADTGLAAGTTYVYAVNAFDPAGNISALSSGTSASTAAASVPGSASSGGGGGGGGGYYAPAFTPAAPSPGPAVPSLASAQGQLLVLLIQQLKALVTQAASQGVVIPQAALDLVNATPSSPATSEMATFVFTRDLQVYDVGNDVKQLQKFLNAQGFLLSQAGPGSPGNETTKFGAKTKAALIRFQKSVGITPASGYFGPVTRAYVRNLMQ
jgi:hypothetical protein